MTFKELLIRHLRSAGFQRRFRNIYLPFLKTWLAAPYNRLHTWWFKKWYEEQSIAGEASVVNDTELEPEGTQTVYEGANIEPLMQEDAVEVLKPFLINHERQNFGMCVTHSIKNIFRFAAKAIFKGYVNFSEHDIYLDRATRNVGLDAGMYPTTAIDRVIGKGIAIDGIVPDPTVLTDLNTKRSDYPDEKVQPFRIKLLKSQSFVSGDFNKVWDFITATYAQRGVRVFQFSITSMSDWWTSDVPKPTGKNLGGHSVVGVTIPFLYRGKRAFFAIDSSYRNGLVWQVATGIRIVTEDCWNGLGKGFRPIEFVDEVEIALGGKVVEPVPRLDLLTVTAEFGQSNEHVTKIQKALIAMGFDIPAISSGATDYGYYGQQTADAVLAFHQKWAASFTMLNKQWNYDTLTALGGRSFGSLSLTVMNNLILNRG